MKIFHTTVGEYLFNFSFEGTNDFLTISTPPTAEGPMLFSWTPGGGVGVTRIISDPASRLEIQRDTEISEFPFSKLISVVQGNSSVFKKRDYLKILSILDQHGVADRGGI
jgi:hypothetical protein